MGGHKQPILPQRVLPSEKTKSGRRAAKRTRRNRALVAELLDASKTYDVPITHGTSVVDNLQAVLDRAMDLWRMACKQVDKLDEDEFWFSYIDAQGNTLYEPHKWIKYEQALRGEVLDMSIRMGHLGIDERKVRVQEAQVELMGRALLSAAQRVGLSGPIQKALGAALREELEVMEGTAVDVRPAAVAERARTGASMLPAQPKEGQTPKNAKRAAKRAAERNPVVGEVV